MKIFISSDHAGYGLKNALKVFLLERGNEVVDLGPNVLDPLDDYPDFIIPVARAVALERDSRGIIIGGSGQGEAIAANRIHGVRAVVIYDGNMGMVHATREHNDANILSFGARFISEEDAKVVTEQWLSLPFTNEERHKRRLEKIENMTK